MLLFPLTRPSPSGRGRKAVPHWANHPRHRHDAGSVSRVADENSLSLRERDGVRGKGMFSLRAVFKTGFAPQCPQVSPRSKIFYQFFHRSV
jgi:hypothetical protein